MKVFASYSRHDSTSVEQVKALLSRFADVWYDSEITGGQRWWDEILQHIAASDVVVFCVSPASVRSRACGAELAYANALGKPVLPLLVRATNLDLAPSEIGITNVVDFQKPTTAEAATELFVAIHAIPPAPPLPDPLPPPPPAPVSDLGHIRDRLNEPSLSYSDQVDIVVELKRHLDDIDEQPTLLALVHQFRSRPDVAESVARDLDHIALMAPVDMREEPVTGSRRPMSERDPGSIDLLRSLVTHIRGEHLTPILGFALTESMLGSRRWLARQWATTFEFPMAEHASDDLAEVAQFVSAMTNPDTLISSMRDFLAGRLLASGLTSVGDDSLAGLVAAAWARRRTEPSPDPHTVVAQLHSPIFVNASPWSLLPEALREAGREPVVELCRWRPDVYDWPASIFETEPDYRPSVQRPLVFQVFGSIEVPDSLVITEDDYIDFTISVAADRSLIPAPVRRALADSALLLLGFELQSWDVRVLLRTLLGQEGGRKLHKYTHVAAQIDPTSDMLAPPRARRYLERYFGKVSEPSIDLYWGSVDEFVGDLDELMNPNRPVEPSQGGR